MYDTCMFCNGKSTRNTPLTKCATCDNVCHAKCADLSSETFPAGWVCKICSEPTLKDIMKELKLMTAHNSTITNKINACQQSIEEIKTTLNNQELKLGEYISLTNELKKQNDAMETQISQLSNKLKHLEQYSRANCVELHGIPATAQEDIFKIISSVGKVVAFNITPAMIDIAHRLRPKPYAANKPSGIIIKFVRRYDKDAFLKAVKTKRNLNSHNLIELQMLMEYPICSIFAVESLSPDNKQLFHKYKQFKKDNNFKFLWTNNGKIFLRKSEGSFACIITTEDDIKKLGDSDSGARK